MLLKCSTSTCFLDEKREADDEPLPPPPRVYVQNVLVCTFERPQVLPHASVVRYTRGRFECTHGVFSVPHHTTHRTHTTTHHSNTTPTTHGDRDMQRQRKRETEKEDREDKTTEERRERRFIFSVVVHGRSLLMECFFLLIPFARETCAC